MKHFLINLQFLLYRRWKPAFLIGLSALLIFGCGSEDKSLKIAATAVPHAEILEFIKPGLENQGVKIKIVEVDDYNLPNRLLYEKQVDANFFQHEPYLELQNRQFGYNLLLLAKVHIEPMGLYSEKIENLDSLRDGAIVAIPSDPTNEARSLKLLSELGLIKLRATENELLITVDDVIENPKNLKLQEVDSPFLPRALPDVDIAVIPANFALQGKLNPTEDALALESANSPYANVLVIREEDREKAEFKKLKEALNSDKLREFIKQKYKGAVSPAF